MQGDNHDLMLVCNVSNVVEERKSSAIRISEYTFASYLQRGDAAESYISSSRRILKVIESAWEGEGPKNTVWTKIRLFTIGRVGLEENGA